MGPIVHRGLEYLATSDRSIIVMRRMLLEAARAGECGESPRRVDRPIYRLVRSHDGLVPRVDRRDAFAAAVAAWW